MSDIDVCAQTELALFKKANNLYHEGAFDKAREIYEKIIDKKNTNNADIFYNLANCYFKMNNVGKAVLNYKRAFLLNPRDKLINDNLSFARGFIQFKDEDARNWYIRKAEEILSYITKDELYICSLFFFLLIIMCRMFLLLFTMSKMLKRLSILLGVLFFISLSTLVIKYSPLLIPYDAVIIAEGAEVRYGPSTTDKVAFRLTAGIEVLLKSEKDDWVKISLHSGKEGWIKKSSLEAV